MYNRIEAIEAFPVLSSGGVFCNSMGFVLGCFDQSSDVGFAFQAELYADIFD